MTIENNISLKTFNTFGIAVIARQLVRISSKDTLLEVLQNPLLLSNPRLILGGGSNILFREDYGGLVMKNEIMGREVIRENPHHVWVSLGAGENWHEVVLWAIENKWGGLENLSLIPGTVGAAPMQNIGAYGVELASVFESLEAIHLKTGEIQIFKAADCQFGYRQSVFKGALKGQHMITSVMLRLSKRPLFNISYGALKETLEQMGVEELGLKQISDAVIHIRQSKLPNPLEIGNAGSFFKNPTIPEELFRQLKHDHPDLPGYPTNHHSVKVPAGWLIEKCQWKGIRRGAIGVHEKQALVLVNHGGGKGKAIHQLALDIQRSVKKTFDIELAPEVNII